MEALFQNFDTIIDILAKVIAAFAALAAITPTPADDSALAAAKKVINFLGLNFGHAANKK